MNCEEAEDLIGTYAIGALSTVETAEMKVHLSTCEKHPEAADLRAVASTLAFGAPEMEPPAALKARLMAAITEETAPPEKAAERGGLLGWLRQLPSRRVVPYALGGALAVAVAALIITNIGGSDEPERAVITMTGANEARGVLHELEDGIVVMEVAGLEPLEADQTYQVWAIRGSDAESLGLLGTAPEGEAIGAMRVDLADVDAIAVSTEPADGSVSPTTDPVLQTEDLSS